MSCDSDSAADLHTFANIFQSEIMCSLAFVRQQTNKQAWQSKTKPEQQREMRTGKAKKFSSGGAWSVCNTWHPWQPGWVSTVTERWAAGRWQAPACCGGSRRKKRWHAAGTVKGTRRGRWKSTPSSISSTEAPLTKHPQSHSIYFTINNTTLSLVGRRRCSSSGKCGIN